MKLCYHFNLPCEICVMNITHMLKLDYLSPVKDAENENVEFLINYEKFPRVHVIQNANFRKVMQTWKRRASYGSQLLLKSSKLRFEVLSTNGVWHSNWRRSFTAITFRVSVDLWSNIAVYSIQNGVRIAALF